MNTSDITGIVKDSSGGGVAAVLALNLQTGLKRTSVTHGFGEFSLTELPAGDYSISVSAHGFKKVVREAIVLHAGDHIRQNFTLTVGKQDLVMIVEGGPEL
jgi:carboxypeptidase family protein